MGVHNLEKRTDYNTAVEETKNAHSLMVIDCFATWCGPCKQIAPVVVKFSNEMPDVKFYKVDVDEVPDVAQELGIRAMPTFVLIKDGEVVETVVGANPQALKAAVEKHRG